MDQLSTLLEKRVADVPVGPPPIDAMRAAVRRRRNRTAVLASAAAVVVIAAGAVGWQAAGFDPDLRPPVASEPPTNPDVPPAGHRFVGVGAAVIAVPESWGTNETECGTPQADTVVIDQGAICAADVPRPASVDSIEARAPLDGEDFSGWTEGEVDGAAVLRSPVESEGGVTTAAAYVPAQAAVFVAESSSADAAEVVNDLLAGIAILQEHATVPVFNDLSYDLDPRPAVDSYAERLRELGLAVEVVRENSPMSSGDVLAADPAVGSVVASGDTVTVTVAR